MRLCRPKLATGDSFCHSHIVCACLIQTAKRKWGMTADFTKSGTALYSSHLKSRRSCCSHSLRGAGSSRARHQEADHRSAPTCQPRARWKPRKRDAATNVATKRGGQPVLLSQLKEDLSMSDELLPIKTSDFQPLRRTWPASRRGSSSLRVQEHLQRLAAARKRHPRLLQRERGVNSGSAFRIGGASGGGERGRRGNAAANLRG